MNILLKELKKFSRQNWWVFVIFFIALTIIFLTEKGNIYEVILVFMCHFLGDLLMMMMGHYYSVKDYKKGAMSQAIGNLIFLVIGLYAIFSSGEWQYFLPTFAFMMGAVKTYFLQVKSKDIKYLNVQSVILLNIIIFGIYIYFNLFETFYSVIQFIGFCMGAAGLIIQEAKKRYIFYVLGTSLIALGSLIGVYYNFLGGGIKGTSISYFLLPLTVVVFYLKNIKKYLK